VTELGKIKALDQFSPSQGLMSDFPPTILTPGFIPRCKNVRFLNGTAYKRTGYTSWGDNQTDGAMLLQEFRTSSGTTFLILATLDRPYKYNSTNDEWDDISGDSDIFTGGHSDIFCATQYLDNFILTNGKDNIYVWTGAGNVAKLTGADGYQVSANHTAKVVVAFKERIFLLNVKEDANWAPSKLRWCDDGDITAWTGGNSGYNTLAEDRSDIVGGMTLGNDLAIYKGQSIVACRYTGQTPLFSFDTMISDLGLAAARCLVDVGSLHFFLGSDYDLHMYQGGATAPSITKDRVRRELMSTINKEYALRSFAVKDMPHHTILFFVPTETEYPDTCWVYDYLNRTWAKDRLADAATAGGVTSRPTGLMIDDLVGLISVQHWLIDDMETTDQTPTIILGDKDGDTFQLDNYAQSDGGSPIEGFLETPDYVAPKDYQRGALRHTEFQFEARGDSVDLAYSEDEGQTWTELETVELDSNFAIYTVFLDLWSRKVRYRFFHSGATGTYWLRWWSPKVVQRSGR